MQNWCKTKFHGRIHTADFKFGHQKPKNLSCKFYLSHPNFPEILGLVIVKSADQDIFALDGIFLSQISKNSRTFMISSVTLEIIILLYFD